MKHGAVLGVVVLLAACGSADLSERDPAGAEACDKLAFYAERENATVALGGMLVVGEAASLADTPAIAGSATQLGTLDQWIVDEEKLRGACEAEGVDIPD